MGLLWTCLNAVSSLLEPEERQSVLGDIHERGASMRDLADVTALVLLRQLQSFLSWRTWALGIAMYVPAAFVLSLTYFLANAAVTPYLRGGSLYTASIIGVPVFAWNCGYALGALGKRRVAILLPLIPVAVFALGGAVFRAWDLLSLAVWLIPALCALLGFLRGIQNRPLSRIATTVMTLLGIIVALRVFPISSEPRPAIHWMLVIRWLLTGIMLWPAAYVLFACGLGGMKRRSDYSANNS